MFLKSINIKILATFGVIFCFQGWAQFCTTFNWAIYVTAGIFTGTTIYDIWIQKDGE